MRAEMQHRMGAEILAEVAVEGREGMGGREVALEEQPHRVAFVTEGRLDADKHIAEALAQHMDVAAVALLPAGGRAPLRLDLRQMGLAPHVVVGRDAAMDIGVRPEALGIALENAIAQRIHGGRHLDRVAIALQGLQGIEQQLEDAEESRRAGAAARWAGS